MLLNDTPPDIRLAARRRARHGGGRRALAVRTGWTPVVVVGIVATVALGCTAGSPPPQPVPLEALATEQDTYDGSIVIASGRVQTYEEPRHYWIEDTAQHRVELFPHELVEDLVGQRIRVTGRFTFRDDRGRGIDIDEIEVLSDPPTALLSTIGAGRCMPGVASSSECCRSSPEVQA